MAEISGVPSVVKGAPTTVSVPSLHFFYCTPKSLLAISVRQGRQQLDVITGSPSLLLHVLRRMREKRVGQAAVYPYLFIFPAKCCATYSTAIVEQVVQVRGENEKCGILVEKSFDILI